MSGHKRKAEDDKQQDRLTRETEEGDVQWPMTSNRGHRIVWHLLDRAGVVHISFNKNAMTMAFAEGARNDGLRLLSFIHSLCPTYAALYFESCLYMSIHSLMAIKLNLLSSKGTQGAPFT